MPDPVPQACQAIADQLSTLEAQDQALRTQLANLTGADAWAALVQLGQIRQQITVVQSQLNACIAANSAALQANFVVIDVSGAGGPAPSRVANLWEITPTATTLSDTSTVSGNSFSFKGPLPTQFGLSVLTSGVADIIGPDFLSAALAAADFAGNPAIRLETVLGPELKIDAATIATSIAGAFTPVNINLSVSGIANGTLSVQTLDASATSEGIQLRANGQLDITVVGTGSNRATVSGNTTLSLVPSATPTAADIFDVVTVSDVTVEITGSAVLAAIAAIIKSSLAGLIQNQLRDLFRKLLPSLVLQALVLPNLPNGVILCIRRLAADPTSITVQPALAAAGTVLSTFHPPTIPPP